MPDKLLDSKNLINETLNLSTKKGGQVKIYAKSEWDKGEKSYVRGLEFYKTRYYMLMNKNK